MSTILDKIILQKRKEVLDLKTNFSFADFERGMFFKRNCISLQQGLMQKKHLPVIAEYKRQSPSKGVINATANVQDVIRAYERHSAVAVSILTDELFFGGNKEDIVAIRPYTNIPVLRKEFIIDEIQLLQSKAIGADVVLLIAACLSPAQVKQLSVFAQQLGMEVILEVHTVEETDHICPSVNIVGINNRDLRTFEVDLENSVRLRSMVQKERLTIAESGIHDIEAIYYLQSKGLDGFLIGELFMQSKDPGAAFQNFIHHYNLKEDLI